jgi:hypothetical protein
MVSTFFIVFQKDDVYLYTFRYDDLCVIPFHTICTLHKIPSLERPQIFQQAESKDVN